MPKKKPTSKNIKKKKYLINWALPILLLLVFGATIYISATSGQRSLENKFMLLDNDVDSLRAELDAKFPDKTFEKEKYCTNYSGELFKGPLHCDIVLHSEHTFSTSDLYNISQTLLINGWQENSKPTINKNGNTTPGVYQNKKSGFKCQLDFMLDKSTKNIKLNYFWCQELSKRSFYPYHEI